MRARIVAIALSAVLALLVAACAPGTPDLGYSPSGSVAYGPVGGGADGPVQLVARADGGVVATRSSDRPLIRIGADGVVDAAWGSTLPNTCRRTGRAVATGTSVLLACSHLTPPRGPEVWQVWRVTAAGALDPTFGGGDGIVDIPSDLNQIDIAALPNGGFLGVGHAETVPSLTSVPPLVAVVYSRTGTVLSSTQITIPVDPLPDVFDGWRLGAALFRTPNGVAAAEAITARLTTNGFEAGLTRVQHFDANGMATDAPAFAAPTSGSGIGSEHIVGIAALSNGRTAIASTTTLVNVDAHSISTDSSLRMTRADGSPDPGFGFGGTVTLQLPAGGRFRPEAVVVTTGCRFILVAGSPPRGGPIVARYDGRTGALDPTFGDHGAFPVFLAQVAAGVPRGDADQVYFGGFDTAGRPAVTRVWNQTTP